MRWFDFKSAIIVIQSINIFNFSGIMFIWKKKIIYECIHVNFHS